MSETVAEVAQEKVLTKLMCRNCGVLYEPTDAYKNWPCLCRNCGHSRAVEYGNRFIRKNEASKQRASNSNDEWAARDDDFLIKHLGKLPHSKLAEMLRRSIESVASRVRDLKRSGKITSDVVKN